MPRPLASFPLPLLPPFPLCFLLLVSSLQLFACTLLHAQLHTRVTKLPLYTPPPCVIITQLSSRRLLEAIPKDRHWSAERPQNLIHRRTSASTYFARLFAFLRVRSFWLLVPVFSQVCFVNSAGARPVAYYCKVICRIRTARRPSSSRKRRRASICLSYPYPFCSSLSR